MAFNEDARVKIPAILHLQRLGYNYLSLSTAQRDETTNIFTDIFSESISRINPEAEPHDIKTTFEDVSTRFASKGDILLSARAPVGTINIAKEDCCIGRGLAAISSKDEADTYLFGVITNLKQVFDRRNVNGTNLVQLQKMIYIL